MGFIHHSTLVHPADMVAAALPAFPDDEVARTVGLAEAYERARSALLALSGVSLLRNLGVAMPGEVGGVIAMAREQLDEARSGLEAANRAAQPGIRARATVVRGAVDLLTAEAERISHDGYGDLNIEALQAAQRLLAAAALPPAGMRRFTSVSCAAYPGWRDGAQEPGQPHDHTLVHHQHSHPHTHHQ